MTAFPNRVRSTSKNTMRIRQSYTLQMFSSEGEMTIVFVPNESWTASSIPPALSYTSPWAEAELTIDWFVLLVKKPLMSKASHNNDITTHITVPRVSFVAELTMGPDPNTTSEATGSTRGSSPKGRMTFQKMLRYQSRFCLVVPKRRKNAIAKIGLTH